MAGVLAELRTGAPAGLLAVMRMRFALARRFLAFVMTSLVKGHELLVEGCRATADMPLSTRADSSMGMPPSLLRCFFPARRLLVFVIAMLVE